MEDHHCVNVPVAEDELNTRTATLAHITRRRAVGPVTVDDQYDRGTRIARFNSALAVAITKGVGSMWCAYAFVALSLVGLPSAIHAGVASTVQWIAQTFLQLVLLSIILVGQNVQAAAADKRALDTYTDAEQILHQVSQIHAHLMGKTPPCASNRPCSASYTPVSAVQPLTRRRTLPRRLNVVLRHRDRDHPGRQRPQGWRVSSDGHRAYITNSNFDTVSVIDIG